VHEFVTSIVEDARGFLWVGTDGAGLNRLDPRTGVFTRYRHDPSDSSSLSADTVFSLHIDSADSLWIGTRGGGLDRLTHASEAGATASFDNYSERDGLPNEVVYAILADSSGHLWMSTNRGLSRFDLRTETFLNYDASDGLQSDEFHFGSAFRSSSGELFFGGVNGFNSFFPERLRHNTYVPQSLGEVRQDSSRQRDVGRLDVDAGALREGLYDGQERMGGQCRGLVDLGPGDLRG